VTRPVRGSIGPVRPAEVCRKLLAALEASEGRRTRRKRDTTPDALGMALKRRLLEDAAREDPAPEAFEGWLLERALGAPADVSVGAMRAMAIEVFREWRFATESCEFESWLDAGAPSDDRTDADRARESSPGSISVHRDDPPWSAQSSRSRPDIPGAS
jgi:hypothetical protein